MLLYLLYILRHRIGAYESLPCLALATYHERDMENYIVFSFVDVWFAILLNYGTNLNYMES